MTDMLNDSAEREVIRGFRGFEVSPLENERFRPDVNLLVRAGAGSGKTTALVERMVALVRSGVSVEHMAAITFTMKAASEMRERFYEALTDCRAQMVGDQRNREVQLVGEALQQVDSVFIDTIHSFCTRLLRERPLLAGIAPDFSIIDDREEELLARTFWNGFVTIEMTPGSPAFETFQNVGINVSTLFTHFRARVKWGHIPAVSTRTACPEMMGAISEMQKTLANIEEIMPPAASKDDVMKLIDSVKRFLSVRGIHDAHDQAALLSTMDSLVTSEGLLKGQKLKKRTWYRSKKDPISERVDQIMEPSVGSDSPYSIPLCVTDHIRPVLNQWWAYLDGIIEPFVTKAVDDFSAYRKSAGRLSFTDLLVFTTEMLRSHPSARVHFGKRFRRLLVDEFQDTDPMQAELLFLLTATDPSESDWKKCSPKPGALFVVGDDKQSIFRFRDADLRIFGMIERLMEQTGGLVLTLTTNFRSAPALCEWNNQALRPLFEVEKAPYQAPYHDLRSTPMNQDMNGAVLQLVTTKIPYHRAAAVAEVEADRIADLIHRARKDGAVETEAGALALDSLGFGDVMILVREWTRMQYYADALERRGIPYTMAGGKALGSTFVLAPLLDLLDAVLNPQDDVATVAYLRGPFAGISDAALYRFVGAGGFSFGAWSVPEKLVPSDAAQWQDAYDTLTYARNCLTGLSPSDAISRIVVDRGILATISTRPGGSAAAGGLQRILSLIREWEGAGLNWAEVTEELRRLKEGHLKSEGMTMEIGLGQGVQILNVHQAKGLEARLVFLADPLGGQSREEVFSHVSRTSSGSRLVMPVRESRGPFASHVIARPLQWEDAVEAETRFGQAEKHRLLYVAATRAAEMLIVSRYSGFEEDGKESKGTWAPLYPALDRAGVPRITDYQSADINAARKSEFVQANVLEIARNRLADSEAIIKRVSVPTYTRQIASGLVRNGHGTRTGSKSDGSLSESRSRSTQGSPNPTDSSNSARPPDSARLPDSDSPRGSLYGTLVHRLFEWAVLHRTSPNLRTDAQAMVGILASNVYSDSRTWDQDAVTVSALDALDLFVQSEIWSDILRSQSVHPEISFSLKYNPVDEPDSDFVPSVLAGAIDLVYRGDEGWVLVDYKTDFLSKKDLIDRYGAQLEAYEFAWQSLTGEKIIEKGFLAVGSGEYIPIKTAYSKTERM